MRKWRGIVVIAMAVIGSVLLAPQADAKVLAYDLEVLGTTHRAGRPVTVVMHPHPQNDLGASFNFELRWAKVRKHRQVARAVRRPGKRIMMHRVAPDEYRGRFTPKSAGLHIVYGSTGGNPPSPGYPEPIRVRVKR